MHFLESTVLGGGGHASSPLMHPLGYFTPRRIATALHSLVITPVVLILPLSSPSHATGILFEHYHQAH